MQLVSEKRGEIHNTETLDSTRVMLICTLPLNEILVDYDKLKSITRGYGSMDYEYAGYRSADLVKMEMLISGEPVDAFSIIVHRAKAEARGRHLAQRLKEVITAATVPGGDSSNDRRQDHHPGDHSRSAEECHRQMLRRGHHPETQASRKTESGQETDEIDRQGQYRQNFIQVLQKQLTEISRYSWPKARPKKNQKSRKGKPEEPVTRRQAKEARLLLKGVRKFLCFNDDIVSDASRESPHRKRISARRSHLPKPTPRAWINWPAI